MNNKQRSVSLGFLVLAMTALACNFSVELPWDVGAPDVQISPEQVSEAATRAAEAAATAAVLAGRAGELAATAALEGDSVLATAVAQGEGLVPTIAALATPPAGASGTALEAKLNNIQTDANGNFSLAITETDLNDYIAAQQQGAFQADAFSLENPQIGITPEQVELSGALTQPLQAPLRANLLPRLNNGQLEFEVLNASVGGLPVPAAILDLVAAGMNLEVARALSGLPAGVTLQDVALQNGAILISGHQG